MGSADVTRVAEIAKIGFPDHFEDRGCFENRLALSPAGCFVLEVEGAVQGYVVAYPWRRWSAPILNARIAAIPADADTLFLHDLALDPSVRGKGLTGPILDRLTAEAREAGWPAIALVAVNNAARFWERQGFVVQGDPAMGAKLASYGPDARYMMRVL